MLHRLFITSILLSFIVSLLSAEAFQVIRSGSLEGLADDQGQVLIPPVYDAIGWSNQQTTVHGELIGYKEGEGWGLISVKNKKLTSPQFTILVPFDETHVKAAIKGRLSNHLFHGLIDKDGKVTVNFEYFSIDRLSDKSLKVSEYRDRSVFYGVLNDEGHAVVPREFHDVDTMGTMYIARLSQKQKLFSFDGVPVLDFWVDEVSRVPEGVLLKKEGRYGLVSLDGQLIHKVAFKHIDAQNARPFQTWKIEGADDSWEVSCDSLTRNSNGSWTAYLNGHEHLLSAEAMKFAGFNEFRLADSKGNVLLMQNQSNLKWAVFNHKSETLVSGKDSVFLDSSYFYVQEKDKWDVYNFFGRKLNTHPLDQVMGSQKRMVGVRRHKYWGWMNFTGQKQIEFKFDSIKAGLSEDQFAAQYVGKWGVANFEGEYPILPEYDRIECHGRYYVAYKGRAAHIFNASGKHVYVTASDVSGDKVLRLENEGKVGAIFSDQNIFYPVYDSIQPIGDYFALYSDGFASVQDQEGEQVFNFQAGIQEVYGFSEDFFLIRKDQKFGLVDSEGRLLIVNRYDGAQCFSEGRAAVSLIGKWGFVDKQELLKVQPFYNEVSAFKNGKAIVRRGSKYGIIDKDGREVLKMEWNNISRQATGNYILEDQYGRYGMANMDAEIILSPLFESIEDVGNDQVIVQKSGKKGIMTYDGYTVTPFKYDRIEVSGDQVLLLEHQLY
ncbi:WG repeat-containing protein [Marinoscillum sp. MHG1-6]|uniref:WG repeat-containing protein n=1 Tax=Marinoscillum sp. MHG1-6 TaxID=2959627 RepID=UPI0021582C19|nr:WG repeat-containing protein [Marinoscillum sp. MHG1-6]